MTVKTGSAWAGLFVTLDATGALAAGTPSGVLYVDGVANAATVTITGSNPYKWSVTLPELTAGQRVDMYITATISTIATAGVVASEQADTAILSDGVTLAATQGAITWGQQKIIANVANQGALDILNSNTSGYGQQNRGYQGLRNYSDVANGAGQSNIATQTGGRGVQNYTSGANGISQQNSAVGDSGIAIQAYASGASSIGHQVVGVAASISGTLSNVTNVTNVTNAVKISTGTGAGQLDVVSGVVKANLAQILGTALTETTGQIAAAFKKFFDKASPTGTINSLPDEVPGTGGGLATTLHVQEVEDKVDTIDGIVDAVKAKTDLITTGTVITVTSPVSGSTITAIRGDTLVAVLENIGTLTNYSKLWFTVKSDEADTDATAQVQIELAGGLLYINGVAATTAANGSITINDESTGDVTILLKAPETAKLSPGSYYYDIQILRSTGILVSTLTSGMFVVAADVTRATS